ncbi:MAG: Omp28-related outer membrane protein [candidate division WOR-3 bacterium]
MVELHSNPGDFGYFAEAGARVYFYDFQGYPSLFLDGRDIWTSWSPSDWRDSVEVEMTKPAPVTLTITGSYNPSTNTGTINAAYRNDSTASITARIYFVITEDSLYHPDPNGHAWHNHLARDFLPDQTGEQVTISPSQTVTRSRSFTIDAAWNENKCYIVTWLQADAPSRNVFQAGEVRVMELVGVEENTPVKIDLPWMKLRSNPCTDDVKFTIHLCNRDPYIISIYDIQGQLVRVIRGIASNGTETITWDRNNGSGRKLSSGVYFYKFQSNDYQTGGKIILE